MTDSETVSENTGSSYHIDTSDALVVYRIIPSSYEWSSFGIRSISTALYKIKYAGTGWQQTVLLDMEPRKRETKICGWRARSRHVY
jgi:hypothetical protein